MAIIAVANQKGGVAKTTTAVNVGGVLGDQGHSVLLVDLDPQGNLTLHAGLNPDQEATLWPLLRGVVSTGHEQAGDFKRTLDELWDEPTVDRAAIPIVSRPNDNPFDIIAANLDLSDADLVLNSAVSRERALAMVLQPIRDEYEYVFLDCAPHLGILTLNALTAADYLLIPLQASFLASNGMNQLFRFYMQVRKTVNPDLEILGVLLTLVDRRTAHALQIAEGARQALAGRVPVFEVQIPQNVDLADASAAGRCITHHAPRSKGAAAYRAVAEEIEDMINDS